MAEAVEEVADFQNAGRMRNRNIRLEVNQEEALIRAAEQERRNVSDMIRLIITGQSQNLVERGLLCSVCLAVDCISPRCRDIKAKDPKTKGRRGQEVLT